MINMLGVGSRARPHRYRLLQSLAYHEAGHSVVAYFFNFEIRRLTIPPAIGPALRNPLPPYFSKRYVADLAELSKQEGLENRATICLAGPVAQRLYAPSGFRRQHAELDYNQAREFLHGIVQDKYELEAYMNLVEVRARGWVSREPGKSIVALLAGRLFEHGTVSAYQVRATISEALRSIGPEFPESPVS